MHAYVIVDLGFGDSGKGLLTDFLVRRFEAGVVVRYNGGAQAGHNVVTADGRHHTFSQFGAGTFVPHVKTYLSKHVVIHPTALLVEGDLLESKGVQDPYSRLRVSDQALVITPFQQAANRIREIVRGTLRHGSCGVGVGETVEDSLSNPTDSLLAGDLNNPSLLQKKMQKIREQKREQILTFCKENSFDFFLTPESETFERKDVIDTWTASIVRIAKLGLVVSDSVLEHWFQETDHVVFEGAQGVLLDENEGFHPYTTWSRSTSSNARDLIKQMAPDANILQIGLLRSFMVRHGPGPLPTETEALSRIVSDHNSFNEWQGQVRYGWFDAVLARYALHVNGGVDTLAITHMDMLTRLQNWQYCVGYEKYNNPLTTITTTDDILTNLHLSSSLSLEQRTQVTQALLAATPICKNCDANDKTVIQEIEALTGHQVGIVSHGPSAGDVKLLKPLPV